MWRDSLYRSITCPQGSRFWSLLFKNGCLSVSIALCTEAQGAEGPLQSLLNNSMIGTKVNARLRLCSLAKPEMHLQDLP